MFLTGEKLDPMGPDLQWHPIPEMFSPRSNFATVILDDMIFVVGGFNGPENFLSISLSLIFFSDLV